MAADLKPETLQAKKQKVKQGAETETNYILKKHKRKNSKGETITCAIHDKKAGKQISQLSSNVSPQCESIVKGMVSELNEGKKTVDDIRQELQSLKGSG